MCDYYNGYEPTYVSRDAGYSKLKLISPENRKKAKQKVNNPNIVTGKYKLKEIFSEMGIIVNPDTMTYLFEVELNKF